MAIIRLRSKVSDVSIHDSKLASLEIELLDSREIKSRNDDLILKEEEKKKVSINFNQISQLSLCLPPRSVQCFDKILFKQGKK